MLRRRQRRLLSVQQTPSRAGWERMFSGFYGLVFIEQERRSLSQGLELLDSRGQAIKPESASTSQDRPGGDEKSDSAS